MMSAVAVRQELASAAVVRRAIAADLATHGVAQDSVDDVVLVISELVGNAVLHAGGANTSSLDVTWDVVDGAVLVRVFDGSSDAPAPRTPDNGAYNGRGLAIVAALSTDWGVWPTANGKQVWARVPVRYAC